MSMVLLFLVSLMCGYEVVELYIYALSRRRVNTLSGGIVNSCLLRPRRCVNGSALFGFFKVETPCVNGGSVIWILDVEFLRYCPHRIVLEVVGFSCVV